MTKTVVLDSFALVSLFHKEPGWEKMREILYELSSSKQKALLNIINWGEFYYIIKRKVEKQRAEEALVLLKQLPIELVPVDETFVKEAATIKSEYPISYADAFCVATANRYKGQILTHDPEFRAVEHLTSVTWLSTESGS